MFFSPWDAWVCGSSPSGDEDVLGLNNFGHIVVANKLDLVGGEKPCQLVVVFYLLGVELLAVAEVQGANVVLDLLRDCLPAVCGASVNIPARSVQVLLRLAEQASVVEQLLGDASHVHACASESPFSSLRGGLYEISDCDSCAVGSR